LGGPDQERFQAGRPALIREVWHGRVKRAVPCITVRDSPDLIALYAPRFTVVKYPHTPEGARVKPADWLASRWVLTDERMEEMTSLRLAIPGAPYSVILFRYAPEGAIRTWYLNLEDPLRRTALGFDVNDRFLDVLVAPDLSSWQWKDEDELAEAVELGIVSAKQAAWFRAEGERAAEWIVSGKSPFTAWADWRPDPSWGPVDLPPGWNEVR